MTTLPSSVLVLCDRAGEPFGFLRLAPASPDSRKGDCIFDITPNTPEQGERSEVRWLQKRHYRRYSEHKFAFDAKGALTVSQGDFAITLDPAEGGDFVTRPPAPPVSARWGPGPA